MIITLNVHMGDMFINFILITVQDKLFYVISFIVLFDILNKYRYFEVISELKLYVLLLSPTLLVKSYGNPLL